MSRGPGALQRRILELLAEPGRGQNRDDPDKVWHLVSKLALDIFDSTEDLDQERIRRSLRSLERRGLVRIGTIPLRIGYLRRGRGVDYPTNVMAARLPPPSG